MSFAAIAAFAATVIGYVLFSRLLEQLHISAPMIFILVGGLLGGLLAHQPDRALVRGLAELTLALLLFHDAAQVQPRQLRGDAGICMRLLLIALPLTIAAGYLLARVLFGGGSGWLALLLAAALAPTDAGLGAATVLNPVVPLRVRPAPGSHCRPVPGRPAADRHRRGAVALLLRLGRAGRQRVRRRVRGRRRVRPVGCAPHRGRLAGARRLGRHPARVRRGLASVVFAVIALEEYQGNEAIGQVVGTIAITVLLSVVLHGITADAWAARYGAWASRTQPEAELGRAVQPLAGRGIRRRIR